MEDLAKYCLDNDGIEIVNPITYYKRKVFGLVLTKNISSFFSNRNLPENDEHIIIFANINSLSNITQSNQPIIIPLNRDVVWEKIFVQSISLSNYVAFVQSIMTAPNVIFVPSLVLNPIETAFSGCFEDSKRTSIFL